MTDAAEGIVKVPADFPDRMTKLEHQCAAILFLSSANMFVNIVTIVLSLLIAFSH